MVQKDLPLGRSPFSGTPGTQENTPSPRTPRYIVFVIPAFCFIPSFQHFLCLYPSILYLYSSIPEFPFYNSSIPAFQHVV